MVGEFLQCDPDSKFKHTHALFYKLTPHHLFHTHCQTFQPDGLLILCCGHSWFYFTTLFLVLAFSLPDVVNVFVFCFVFLALVVHRMLLSFLNDCPNRFKIAPVMKPVQVECKSIHSLKVLEWSKICKWVYPTTKQHGEKYYITAEKIQKLLGRYERGCRWKKIAARIQQGIHTHEKSRRTR